MIKLLTPSEQNLVEKEDVIRLEEHILSQLQFDFNHPNSLTFLERFLRLAAEFKESKDSVTEMASELLKVAASKSFFLDYKPSRVAAASMVLAFGIAES
jgi:transcription initiation factor TFIIIB Brf1 subunit/transcription initiation factor TFIIB